MFFLSCIISQVPLKNYAICKEAETNNWINQLNWYCRCSSQEGDNNAHSMDTSKIQQLGFPAFKSLSEMFDDCIKSFQDKGFLWSSHCLVQTVVHITAFGFSFFKIKVFKIMYLYRLRIPQYYAIWSMFWILTIMGLKFYRNSIKLSMALFIYFCLAICMTLFFGFFSFSLSWNVSWKEGYLCYSS